MEIQVFERTRSYRNGRKYDKKSPHQTKFTAFITLLGIRCCFGSTFHRKKSRQQRILKNNSLYCRAERFSHPQYP